MKKRVIKKKSGEHKGRRGKRNDEKILDKKMEGNRKNRKSVVSKRIKKVKIYGEKGRKEKLLLTVKYDVLHCFKLICYNTL